MTLTFYLTGTAVSGEIFLVLGFIQRFPAVLIKMVSFGIASAIGQVS